MVKISILDMRLKITNLQLQLHLPRSNELMVCLEYIIADSNPKYIKVAKLKENMTQCQLTDIRESLHGFD